MMNKKLAALLVAISTISASTFCLLDDVFETTGRVVTAPVDALPDGSGRTWEDKREDREINRERRYDNRRERAAERHERRLDRGDRPYNTNIDYVD